MTEIEKDNSADKVKKFSWYPGHIKLAEQELKNKWLNLLDIVIELIDGRVPISGQYPNREFWGNKKIIQVFTHSDIADKDFLKKHFVNTLSINAHKPHEWKAKLSNLIKDNSLEIKEKLQNQGRRRKIRLGVCGLPNVGKSTFLNSLLKSGKKAQTGNQPGITRRMQWVEGADFDLLDSPGIMPLSVEFEIAYKLALCNLLPQKLFDLELLKDKLLVFLAINYPDIHPKAFDLSLRMKAESFVKYFQDGKLGHICLDLQASS